MDAKITKARLNDMFAYDWIKIIALTVAVVCLWSLLYAFTGVKLSPGQEFTFIVRSVNFNEKEISDFTESLEKKGIFSYEVQSVVYNAITAGNYEENTAFEAGMRAGEGDLFIVEDDAKFDENGDFIQNENNIYQTSDLKAYIDRNIVCSLEDMIAYAKDYCAQFYVDGDISGNGVIDEEFLEQNFRERVKKDNRFRKEKAVQEGIAEERKRIENYLGEALSLEQTLAANPDIVVKYRKYEQSAKLWPDKNYVVEEEKTYAIDLYKLVGATDIVRGESGSDCRGMTICFMNFTKANGDLFYESIAAMNYFIERYGPVRA